MKLKTFTLIASLLCALSSMDATRAADAQDGKIQVNFTGLDLATIARQAEKITKKTFLFDENMLRNMRATLQSETPVTPVEFYRLFQTICQMNDLVLIPVEGAGLNLEKIVKSQVAYKEPGTHPVLVQGENLPQTDNIVSYLVKLQFISPAKALAAISPSLSPAGSVLQIPNTDLLLINDVSSSLKRVQKFVELLDKAGEPIITASVAVINLPVDKAQSQLQEYLQAVSKARTGEGGHERVTLLKDERLNILHLIGTAKEVSEARDFLRAMDLDSPTEKRLIRYYKLKNVPVKDIVDYVGQLLGVALVAHQVENQRETPPSTDSFSPPPVEVPAPSNPQSPPPGFQPTQPAKALAHNSHGKVAGGGLNQTTQNPALNGVEIIPVEGLNTLVVAGDESVQREAEAIINNLDKRKGQVLIEVAIIQVTGSGTLDLGTEFLSINNVNGNNKKADVGDGFGIGTQSDGSNSSTTATSTGIGVGTATAIGRGFSTQNALGPLAGSAFRFVNGDKFTAIISALASKSDVSIVSQPLLLVNDNEEASFTTKVSEPTTTTSQGTATTNTSFSGFADATTALKITPHISPDGYLNLEIVQTFEEFTGIASGAGIPPPKVSNNAATKISIPDRETIVMGGFTRDSSTISKNGIPGLMQIPGLGKLFSHENNQKSVSRFYLFIRPKILSTSGFCDLEAESEKKKEDVHRLSKKSDIRKEMNEKIGRGDTNAEVVPIDGENHKQP